jgi:hypothetical protein
MNDLVIVLFVVCGAMFATAALFCPTKNTKNWVWLDVISFALILLPISVTKAINKIKNIIGK